MEHRRQGPDHAGRQGPAGELSAMSFPLELVTGRIAPASQVLRPAVPDDAPRLVAMFERCSPASRYARFLAPLQHFPASHLVDVVRSSPIRRSWVVDDLDTGDVVGVGSWFRNGRRHGRDRPARSRTAVQHAGPRQHAARRARRQRPPRGHHHVRRAHAVRLAPRPPHAAPPRTEHHQVRRASPARCTSALVDQAEALAG